MDECMGGSVGGQMNECMHESMIGRANEETDRKNE